MDKFYTKKTTYIDKKFPGTKEEYCNLLGKSKTIYITNIPLHVREERLWNLFGIIDDIEHLIMGVDNELKFAGFCFIIYKDQISANTALKLLNGIKIDGVSLQIDKDIGFTEERRYGRGEGGRQMREKYYKKFKAK